ncbi:MAG: DUF58 domain-containing protein, partial [Jatrophihabitans sp.]|uniref:DUF58 domain-containing protein n=1 Tax=Jatrophihabitans sp. TaxID=1932789 RepID=UPI003F7FBDEF
PLLTWLAAQLARRPGGDLRVSVRPASSTLLEDQATTVRVRVTAPRVTDALTVSFVPGEWLRRRGRRDAVVPAAPDGAPGEVEFPVTALRWSRASVGAARVTAWAGQGLFYRQTDATGWPVKVVPYRERFSVGDALPVSSGIVGTHRSRRPGEGTDLAGIRPFQVGDRLKRINWPVSLRTQTLHATATLTDLDATVMLVVDSSTDLVPGDEPARVNGTLDTAVHAAAAIAEHYLRAGDRVGIVDDGQTMRTVLPAAGRAHLNRIVDALIDVDTTAGRRRLPVHLARLLGRIAPRSMVILITPLIEQARPELAVELARSGHPVLVIDSLGEYTPDGPPGSTPDLAWRLQRLQHDLDVDRLADAGIPAVAWRGAGSLNTVLARLSRAAAAPRVRR